VLHAWHNSIQVMATSGWQLAIVFARNYRLI
jgi:hypothetical protein